MAVVHGYKSGIYALRRDRTRRYRGDRLQRRTGSRFVEFRQRDQRRPFRGGDGWCKIFHSRSGGCVRNRIGKSFRFQDLAFRFQVERQHERSSVQGFRSDERRMREHNPRPAAQRREGGGGNGFRQDRRRLPHFVRRCRHLDGSHQFPQIQNHPSGDAQGSGEGCRLADRLAGRRARALHQRF